MDILPIDIDWRHSLSLLTHLAIAYALALPIGLDRQTSSRNFGLRTFPLVSVVSCGFMLVGLSVIASTDGEARVIQGIITGIGFIGGGAIFKGKDHVTAWPLPPVCGTPAPSA
jgi:putative Mg2+ transporter-C (MgtC) family protein